MNLESRRRSAGTLGVLVACAASLSCGPSAQSARIPPAPIVGRWPETTFLPERQCQGRYATEDLERLLPRARLALWLPGTRAVELDAARRCITVTVESIGGGRLAELVLRGVAVPRRSVLLLVEGRGSRSRG